MAGMLWLLTTVCIKVYAVFNVKNTAINVKISDVEAEHLNLLKLYISHNNFCKKKKHDFA